MAEKRAPLPSELRGSELGPPGQALWSRWLVARWLVAILGAAIVLALFALVAPLVPLDPTASERVALLAYGIGYAFVSALVLLVAALAPRGGPGAVAGAGLGLVSLAAVAISGVAPGVAASAVVLVALLALGTGAGALIGARIEHPGHLAIVAVVSSVADVASVASPGGPSHEIAESPELLSILALSWPMVGTTRIEPLLGVGDVVFVALYLAAAGRHGLSLARTVAALASALAVTAVVVAITALPIPALPFLGAAVVLAHPAARLPPPGERRKAALALTLFVALFAALVLLRGSS